MTSETPLAEKERFPALDGLRALAITVVVFHHSGFVGGYLNRDLGVNTLFSISGFLVTWLLLRERRKTGTIARLHFHLRRGLRILPLYYAMLLLYVVMTAVMEPRSPAGQEFWRNLPRYATFTASGLNALGHERMIFVFAWSLSTQERIYLVWPWVIWLVRGRLPLVLAIAGLLTLVPTPFIPPGQATSIWLGACLACLVHHRWGAVLLQRIAGGWWSVPLALAGTLVPLLLPGAPQIFTQLSLAYLVAACLVRPGVLSPLLVNPVAAHVGKVSYGVYLMHRLCLKVVGLAVPRAPRLVTFALGMGLCLVVASLSERFFETPVRKLGLRLIAPKPPRQPPQRPTSTTGELQPQPALQAAG